MMISASRSGTTAAELGRRLGISKQAAGEATDRLCGLGYLKRTADPRDARRKTVKLTDRGVDSLVLSTRIFDELREQWAGELGSARLRSVEEDLRRMTSPGVFRLDVPGWFGS